MRSDPDAPSGDREADADQGGDPPCWAEQFADWAGGPAELPGPVVDAGWLAAALAAGVELVVADVRWALGRGQLVDDFEAGHVPGAVFVGLDDDLSSPASPEAGRHPLPAPEAFAATRAALGMSDGVPVVAYDDAGGAIAARLWWMLTAIGQPAAVLDGGLAAWTAAGHELEQGRSAPPPAPFVVAPRPWPASSLATLADVEAIADRRSEAVLLDARAAARYRGEVVAVDPRPGHIPGAISAETAGNLGDDGRFLSPDDLAERYRRLGAAGEADVVVSCGSGVTACHDALAMVLAGLPRPRLYPGSFSQWSASYERPVNAGAEPWGDR